MGYDPGKPRDHPDNLAARQQRWEGISKKAGRNTKINLRRKTGQYQNSEQAGYSQGANPEVGRMRTDPSHPANVERNAELARRAGKTVSKRTYYGATSNPVRDLDNPSGG